MPQRKSRSRKSVSRPKKSRSRKVTSPKKSRLRKTTSSKNYRFSPSTANQFVDEVIKKMKWKISENEIESLMTQNLFINRKELQEFLSATPEQRKNTISIVETRINDLWRELDEYNKYNKDDIKECQEYLNKIENEDDKNKTKSLYLIYPYFHFFASKDIEELSIWFSRNNNKKNMYGYDDDDHKHWPTDLRKDISLLLDRYSVIIDISSRLLKIKHEIKCLDEKASLRLRKEDTKNCSIM